MGSPHYTPSGTPAAGSAGNSSAMRTEFTAVETGMQVLNSIPMVSQIEDANTAGQIYVAVPWNCLVTKVLICAGANQASGGATGFTLKIGGTAVTDGTGTLATDALIGTVVTITPTALNALLQDGALELEYDGGGTPTQPCVVTFLFQRT